MTSVAPVRERVERLLQNAMLMALRLGTGGLFAASGWGKLHHLMQVAAYFESLHVAAPRFAAPTVATLECAGGLMLLCGAATRPTAVVLAALMGGAIVSAHADEIAGISDVIGLQEFLLAQTLGVLVVLGAGSLSLDAIVRRLWRRRVAPSAGARLS